MRFFAIASKLKRLEGQGTETSQHRKEKDAVLGVTQSSQASGTQNWPLKCVGHLFLEIMNDNPPNLKIKPFSAINSKQMKIKEFDVYVDQENHIIPT